VIIGPASAFSANPVVTARPTPENLVPTCGAAVVGHVVFITRHSAHRLTTWTHSSASCATTVLLLPRVTDGRDRARATPQSARTYAGALGLTGQWARECSFAFNKLGCHLRIPRGTNDAHHLLRGSVPGSAITGPFGTVV
jgi:hypothetical protein